MTSAELAANESRMACVLQILNHHKFLDKFVSMVMSLHPFVSSCAGFGASFCSWRACRPGFIFMRSWIVRHTHTRTHVRAPTHPHNTQQLPGVASTKEESSMMRREGACSDKEGGESFRDKGCVRVLSSALQVLNNLSRNDSTCGM